MARSQREGTQEPAVLELALSFSTKPRIGGGEFVIGSGEVADIRLGSQREGVSARHLLIGFEANRNVTIKDISTCGSRIRYAGAGNEEKHTLGDRHNPSCWVVPQEWPVFLRIDSYALELRPPVIPHLQAYCDNVDSFMRAARQDSL